MFELRNFYRATRAYRTAGVMLLASASAGGFAQQVQSSSTLPVPASLYQEERRLFKQARTQIADNNRAALQKSLKQLSEYPLRQYLEYEYLRQLWQSRQPLKSDIAALNAFERTYDNTSLTRRLTRLLQRRLADTDQWALFLGVSKSRLAAAMPCTTLRARHETGQLTAFDEQLSEYWVKPGRVPKRCAGVIKQMESAHTPPLRAIWEKTYLAIESGKLREASRMLGYLGTRDRTKVQLWLDAQAKPWQLLRSGHVDQNTVLNRRIVADLLVKWSKTDTRAAVEHWLAIRDNYTFFADRRYETHRALVMRAAYRRLPEAQQWLEATDESEDDLELAEWRIRTALLAQDWQSALASIGRLPQEEQEEDHWAYWVARAQESLGRVDQARQIYADLAKLQSYYGFLSADRLGMDYAIYDEPIEPDPQLLQQLASEPALIRAREYREVGLEHESRREWNNWIADREGEEVAASAVLAKHWNLHDRAIFAAGRAEQKRAISLRFPILYRSEVAQASVEHGIEPAWIFGVMRRESAYIRDIRSGAGAIGLMQLMPGTARYVAEMQGQKNWKGDLTDATVNIGFGTHYLRYVLDRFDNHQVLATASYNAGPHRVDAWLRDQEMPADLWIDTIPFTETRRYVRAVLAYAAIYDHHLTGDPQRLAVKLEPVPAAPSI